MGRLYLDFEARSGCDLKKCGAHVYAWHPSTYVLCTGQGEDGKAWVLDGFMSTRPYVYASPAIGANGKGLVAHNAAFERAICAANGYVVPISSWICTAAKAAAAGLPRDLASACAAIGLEHQKDLEGHRLMLRVCKTKNPIRDGDLERLKEYCAQDIRAEMVLDKALPDLTQAQHELWCLDQTINDRGFAVDVDTCKRLIDLVTAEEARIDRELRALTNLGPKQTVALRDWLEKEGLPLSDLRAGTVRDVIDSGKLAEAHERILELRQEGGKSSVAKLAAFQNYAQIDGRARGTMLYYGASTGRWSGRGIQPQNFPRGKKLPKGQTPEGKLFALVSGLETGEVLETASSSLRSLVMAGEGKKLMAADYRNIEGRIAAWLAGENWKVKAFADFDAGTGPDLYKLAYAKAFHKLVDQVTDSERALGKVMELALQYQGWVGAFATMGQNYGVTVSEDRAKDLCGRWREAHPRIVAAWHEMASATLSAVRQGNVWPVLENRCRVGVREDWLLVRLPSGRCMRYYKPQECEGKTGPAVSIMAQNSLTKKWERQQMYGGCWFENVVQGTAADILSSALFRVEAGGFPVVLHVHDEVVAEVGEGASFKDFLGLIREFPVWAEGLPVAAAGWTGRRYRKG